MKAKKKESKKYIDPKLSELIMTRYFRKEMTEPVSVAKDLEEL